MVQASDAGQQHQQQAQETPTRCGGSSSSNNNNNINNYEHDASEAMDDDDNDSVIDEEQLKRILSCKRLSEGCNRFSAANHICRKNSLHLIGESLPPVTEGEPMRHMSHHMSQNIDSTSSSSVSSGSLRSAGAAGVARHCSAAGNGHLSKKSSQENSIASCSSSTSLDGPRSPSRRRSSTVSQCSSVLSEGTRQQLNFDLSPDLPPDSSILEANAISPTDFERPASPEPFSMGSVDGDSSLDMIRPMSRMSSQYCDDIMMPASSPDSTLGDSNENSNPDSGLGARVRLGSGCGRSPQQTPTPINGTNQSDSDGQRPQQQQQQHHRRHQVANSERPSQAINREQHDATIRDNLERIISHVSAVKVSSIADCVNSDGQNNGNISGSSTSNNINHNSGSSNLSCNSEQVSRCLGQKRAHTPFGANLQHNKTSIISTSPSPTT